MKDDFLGIEKPGRRGRALHNVVIPRDICYDKIILVGIVLCAESKGEGAHAVPIHSSKTVDAF